MSHKQAYHGGIVILFSFAIAFILMMFPLAQELEIYRPKLVTLVLIYWCIAVPHRVGVFTGWIVGFFLDIHTDSILGLHALSLAVVAYLSYKLHARIRLYPLFQQSFIILLLVALSQILILWINGSMGEVRGDWFYWIPSLTSTLLWPWLFYLLRNIRRLYGVN
ncbi:MAG: rod shape-determining protein MreD [gamma proteobacterium symbiont of Taylorina sp.]|nr:rod shape-determining protein MreD [gamma proteobacterium symbiont of Taylorina sp.]